MTGEYDLDQPVEVRIRGDCLDVMGALMAMMTPILEDGSENDRVDEVVHDLAKQLNQQVNPGWYKLQAERLLKEGDIFDCRGVQVLVDEFQPQHPTPQGAAVDRLTPLEEAEWYLVFMRSDAGFEAAGYPERSGVEQRMLMASLLRQYARDLEDELPDGSLEADDA